MKKLLAPLLLLLASVAIADEKISGMSPASLPLSGLELAPLVQNGVNVYTPLNNINLGALPPGQPYCIYGNATGSFASPVCNTTAIVQQLQVPIGGSFTSSGSTILSGGINPDGESTLRFDNTQSATGPLGVSIWGLTKYTPNGASNVNFLQTQTHLGASLIPISNYEAMFCAQETIDVDYGSVNAPPAVICFEAQGFEDNRPNATTVPVPNWHGFVADSLQNGNGMSAGTTAGGGFFFNGLNATATNNGGTAVYAAAYFKVPSNNHFAATGSTEDAGIIIAGTGGTATGTIAILDIGSPASPNTGGGDGSNFVINYQSAANITKVFPFAVGQQIDISGTNPGGYSITCTVASSVVVTIATVHTGQITCPGTATGAIVSPGGFIQHGGSLSPLALAFDGQSTLNYDFAGFISGSNGINTFGGTATFNGGTSNNPVNLNTGTSSGTTTIGNANSTLTVNAGTWNGTAVTALFASPPAIGATARSTALVTTLGANGLITGTAGANISGGTVSLNTTGSAVNIANSSGNGLVGIGNGSGKVTIGGPLISANVNSSQFTVAGTGGCSVPASLNGGTQAGDFTCSSTAAATATITLKATTTAYACWGRNITTAANLVVQTGAKSTTGVTLTFTTGTSADVIQFGCLGY